MVRNDRRRFIEASGSAVAAMTCGIPEPLASGANRRVSQTMATKPNGVTSSGAQGQCRTKRPKTWPAASAISANSRASKPIRIAPPPIAARRRHTGPLIRKALTAMRRRRCNL
ncbi:twin-arginine translocation signal domain-containing protein [Rhizorhabdus sp.]|uniref:twin-arginine translocation signal domain-containing protein n=1 Tax=Rhizorhabdus sp. TaxID=1968843 RepID=UPI00344FB51C